MNGMPVVLIWLALMLGLAAELAAAWLGMQAITPFIGIALALLVAFTFMRLASSRGLVTIFAFAGVFWLCVLLALGSLDAATRTNITVVQRTQP